MTMLQPDRPNRSRLLRLINTAGRRLAKNGFPFLRLDEKALLDKACEQTGLDDFGDDSFREAMRVLFRAYETEAELSFVGRICVRGDTLRLLSNRLRLVADRRRQPAMADEVIRRPLFITGLPRSGTTFLHALLAQDPAHRAPQVWEVMHPSPPPERASYAEGYAWAIDNGVVSPSDCAGGSAAFLEGCKQGALRNHPDSAAR